IISRLTQGFSIRCLRFTSDVTVSHARLASGWRAAPLPGGGRTLWIASKGFRSHPILLSRTSPAARVAYIKVLQGGSFDSGASPRTKLTLRLCSLMRRASGDRSFTLNHVHFEPRNFLIRDLPLP